MLIYIKHYGQLCNNIWGLIPIVAYAIHQKERLCIMNAYAPYLDNFPMLKKCRLLWIVNVYTGKRPCFIWRKFSFVLNKCMRQLSCSIEQKPMGTTCVIDGWVHRLDQSYVLEEKKIIQRLFMPNNAVQLRIDAIMSGFNGITVGVHVRRGDYKMHANGRYYYDDNVYIQIINQIADELFKLGVFVRFLICSNESFDMSKSVHQLFRIQDADSIIDLYALAKCDYIIGPPSSYSEWASFYGEVPLCFILHKESKVNLHDFSKIVTLDRFENGKQIYFDEQKEYYYIK